jgi:hypothetical protein
MSKTFKKPVEGFERPDHPDFMDSSELKNIGFNGVRKNSISGDTEIWIEGERRACISETQLKINPAAVDEAMTGIFKIDCQSVAGLQRH